jgi:exosortase A
MGNTQRRVLAATFIVAVVALGWIYRGTLASVLHIWSTNSSFSHGILIVPIAVWLVWRKRTELAAVRWEPSWAGALCVAFCGAGWVLGRGAGVVGLEQFSVFAMVPSLTLAILGWRATWAVSFPLAFLMLGVPVGHALVPTLMNLTADVATWALRVTGVPILRSGMYIAIPGGQFEVARACSGLNYVITGLVLGVLYAYLTYSGWRKRLLAILAFMVIPIVANGVRVYLTIVVSYLTDMRFGPGQEHVWFGRVFFIVVMFLLFWVGQRWRDDPGPAGDALAPQPSAAAPTARVVVPVAIAFLALIAGPLYLSGVSARVEARLQAEDTQLQLPQGENGWSGPLNVPGTWRPLYSGARVERVGAYRDSLGARVDVFVGVYGIGTSGGAEMINYNNRIFADEHKSLGNETPSAVALPDGRTFLVREQRVADERGDHLVWYWFMVGDRPLTSPYSVKAEEARAFLGRGAVTERVITLATPADGDATGRLERFVAGHFACVTAGFAFEACGG